MLCRVLSTPEYVASTEPVGKCRRPDNVACATVMYGGHCIADFTIVCIVVFQLMTQDLDEISSVRHSV